MLSYPPFVNSLQTGATGILTQFAYIDQGLSVANWMIGNDAPYALQAGAAGNLAIGLHAGHSITTGINNTAIGWDSLYTCTTGSNNTALGEDALKLATGDNNTGIGYTAGYGITTGTSNVAIAPNTLHNATSASYNVAVGYGSLQLNVTGNHNIGIGYQALFNVLADDNTCVGYQAGHTTAGSGNVFLGATAGYYETGSNKLFIDNAVRSNEADARTKALIYGIFASTTGAQSVTVNGSLIYRPWASATPANNGEFVIEATNNTTLTFKLKGTDGTVRSATLTLA